MEGAERTHTAMTGAVVIRFIPALLALALAACQPASSPNGGPAGPAACTEPNKVDCVVLDPASPTEIVFWHRPTRRTEPDPARLRNPNEPVELIDLIAEFNATNPYGITVKGEAVGDYNPLYQRVTRAIQANAAPDLVVAYENMSAEYYEADALEPFDNYIASKHYGLSDADQQDLVDAYFTATVFERYANKRLTFPFTRSALVMYTNMEVLRQIGANAPAQTWEQFKEHCRLAVAAGKQCYPMVVDASTANGLVYSFGGDVISPDGKVAWSSPAAFEALRLYQAFYDGKQAVLITERNEDLDLLARGAALYLLRSSTGIPDALRALQGQRKDPATLRITGIPQGAASVRPQTVLFGGSVSILKSPLEGQLDADKRLEAERKKLAAWLFVKWLSSKEITARWTRDNGYFPLRQSALDDPAAKQYFEANPHFAAAFEASKGGKVEPSTKGWQEVRTIIEQAVTGIMAGKLTAEQAKKEIEDRSRRALRD